ARLWKPFESHVLLAMLRTLLSAKSKPASRSEASASVEATAPRSLEPHEDMHEETAETVFESHIHPDLPPLPPKFAPPKSRKDSAMEKASNQVEERFETVQGISPTKAQ